LWPVQSRSWHRMMRITSPGSASTSVAAHSCYRRILAYGPRLIDSRIARVKGARSDGGLGGPRYTSSNRLQHVYTGPVAIPECHHRLSSPGSSGPCVSTGGANAAHELEACVEQLRLSAAPLAR